jgi:hypothetical protein
VLVVRDRIELSTFRFSGAIDPCLTVAGCRLTGHLTAPIVPGRRPVSPGVCLRWLPVWLPIFGSRNVVGLHSYSLAASAAMAVYQPAAQGDTVGSPQR